MSKSTLPVNFQDDILNSSMNGKRRYNLVQNSDGTYSLEDVSTYDQVGSSYGAGQINSLNQAVNESADAGKIIDDIDAINAVTENGYIAGAKALKSVNNSLGGMSFYEDESGNKYVVGADLVPKKLGSSDKTTIIGHNYGGSDNFWINMGTFEKIIISASSDKYDICFSNSVSHTGSYNGDLQPEFNIQANKAIAINREDYTDYKYIGIVSNGAVARNFIVELFGNSNSVEILGFAYSPTTCLITCEIGDYTKAEFNGTCKIGTIGTPYVNDTVANTVVTNIGSGEMNITNLQDYKNDTSRYVGIYGASGNNYAIDFTIS